jgi:hypothetical protein
MLKEFWTTESFDPTKTMVILLVMKTQTIQSKVTLYFNNFLMNIKAKMFLNMMRSPESTSPDLLVRLMFKDKDSPNLKGQQIGKD